MIEIFVLTTVLMITGTGIGVLAVVSLGIRREERAFSLTGDSPDRVARGARRINGLYSRGPVPARETGHTWAA
ncbi:MAG: hypothetical protein ABSB01_22155 [Streptosporangiaceae bacterium]